MYNVYQHLGLLISILREISLNIETIESKELRLHRSIEIVNYESARGNDMHNAHKWQSMRVSFSWAKVILIDCLEKRRDCFKAYVEKLIHFILSGRGSENSVKAVRKYMEKQKVFGTFGLMAACQQYP